VRLSDNKSVGVIRKEKYESFYREFLKLRDEMHNETFVISYLMSILFSNENK
jgi:hypothetical protein